MYKAVRRRNQFQKPSRLLTLNHKTWAQANKSSTGLLYNWKLNLIQGNIFEENIDKCLEIVASLCVKWDAMPLKNKAL